MSQRNLQSPDNLPRRRSVRTDRFDLGLLALIAGWFVLAAVGPFVLLVIAMEVGVRWTLYAVLAAITVAAAFVMFAASEQAASTLSSRLMTSLAALAGLPVVSMGLLFYAGSALFLGAIFWTTVLGLPGG